MARRESAPALAIPDRDAAGVSDTIAIGPAGTIAATRVHLEILHTFIGDLRVVLTSPGGREVVLHNETGEGEDNLIRSYSSEGFTRLRDLSGEAGQGEWKLHVADLVGQDTGTLVRWSMELTYAV